MKGGSWSHISEDAATKTHYELNETSPQSNSVKGYLCSSPTANDFKV
jgi:hypothetical protein